MYSICILEKEKVYINWNKLDELFEILNTLFMEKGCLNLCSWLKKNLPIKLDYLNIFGLLFLYITFFL